MAHDFILRGGTIVDGTGAAARRADVAIDQERITAIGDLSDATATTEIDATDKYVTPGFIDMHTHLDAQIAWDPHMTSSSWHGVTTALIGNCGLSFAPVETGQQSKLAEMMESVEDIPREAILGSLPWSWNSYPEYLDAIGSMSPALNVVGLVGHAPIRFLAMGDRAHDEGAEPTAEELSHMRDMVAESVDGGAVGFSTSRILLHRVPDGRKLPGTYASNDELLALAAGMRDAGGGLFQVVPDYESRAGNEFKLFSAMADAGTDVLFTVGPGNDESVGADVATLWGTFLEQQQHKAATVHSYTMTRPSGSLMGLAQVPPVAGPLWRALMELPTVDDRLVALRDNAKRAALIDEGKARGLLYNPAFVHPLGAATAAPDYHIEGGPSVADLAAEAGVHPVEWIIDRLLESGGRELFNMWFFHRNRSGLEALLALDGVYPGAGDTGAHAGQICDGDAPTHFLSYWCRDRGLVTLPEGIRRLTSKPAEMLGLRDRGTLTVGAFADVNVFDLAALDVGYPEFRQDFPNGKGRFCVGSTGYAATFVNGSIVTENAVNTTARPGTVIRERVASNP